MKLDVLYMKPTNIQLKRWSRYIVDNPKTNIKINGSRFRCSTIAELSEAQAKDELCIAMDLINQLLDDAMSGYSNAVNHARKHRYASPPISQL